jgi:hypothetical protein
MIPTRDADPRSSELADDASVDDAARDDSANLPAETEGASASVLPDPDEAETPEELAAQWEAQGPQPAGGLANACASLVTLALGIFGIAASVTLGVGSFTQPEAGFFPLCMAVVVTALSIVQLIIGRRGGDGEKFGPEAWMTLFGFTSILAFIALLPIIGFEIPGLLLSFVWMKLLGGETWRSTILYSVIIVAAFYVIFVVALGTRIPHLF